MRLSILTMVVVAWSVGPAFAAETHIDVSKVITKSEAESILGAKTKDSTPRNVQGGDGYYSKCNYYSITPGKTLLVRVYQAAPGYDGRKELDMVDAIRRIKGKAGYLPPVVDAGCGCQGQT